MSRPIGRRESFTVKQVEAALRRGAGIESHAAEAMLDITGRPCSRRTIGRMLDKHQALRDLQEELKEQVCDLAQGKLYEAVNAGNMTAIIFTLKTLGARRGFVEQHRVYDGDHHSSGGGDVRTTGRATIEWTHYSKLTLEERVGLYRQALGAPQED